MTKGEAMANKKLVDLLLQDENANVANDEFETLSGSDWVRLLSAKPQFAEKYSLFSKILKIKIFSQINKAMSIVH